MIQTWSSINKLRTQILKNMWIYVLAYNLISSYTSLWQQQFKGQKLKIIAYDYFLSLLNILLLDKTKKKLTDKNLVWSLPQSCKHISVLTL